MKFCILISHDLGLCPANTMSEFHEFINYSALVDLPLRGGEFTWFRSGLDFFV